MLSARVGSCYLLHFALTVMASSQFPSTLRGFGYDFDEGGKLRKLDPKTNELTKEGFEFKVSEDPTYNQKHYEALGEVITQHVYSMLEAEGLRKMPVPKDGTTDVDLRSFVFATEDALENQKLIILIHGSGVVRAGQWARRLIINDNLKSGTQIPYIKKARELGYGVFVLNTNDNTRIVNGKTVKIKGSEDPCTHVNTVWNDYVRGSNVKHVAIIAHSYGGVCTLNFAMNNVDEFKSKVFAVALTDSVHVTPAKGADHIVKVARNWVSSEKPLDTPETCSDQITQVSAGHPVHEMTSWTCIESVFKYIEDRFRRLT